MLRILSYLAASSVALSISGCANLSRSADSQQSPKPMILHANEGEKLLMDGGRYVILKATAEGAGSEKLFMGSEALPPGSYIPVHSHDGYEEIIFIHKGNVSLTLGDTTVEAGPGATMYVPAGTWHGVKAEGDDQATMLFIFPETDMAEFFRSVGHKEGEPPPQLGPDDWARIMEQHQMRAKRP